MKHRRLELDPELVILVLYALLLGVSIPRYAAAFAAAEAPLLLWNGEHQVSWATGILFALGYDGIAWVGLWQGMAARRRAEDGKGKVYGAIWWWPEVGSLVQSLVGFGAILTPVSLAELRSISLRQLLTAPWDWVWCATVMLAPALAALTAALTLAVQVRSGARSKKGSEGSSASDPGSGAGSEGSGAGSNGSSAAAGQPASNQRWVCRYCGAEKQSMNARNAHEGRCPVRKGQEVTRVA